jgi:hypothetical protein
MPSRRAWRVTTYGDMGARAPNEISGAGRRSGELIMNRIAALAFAGLVAMAASTVHGQERGTSLPGTSLPGTGDIYGAVSGPEPFPPGEPRTPLATFGGLNVDVWAPMEQHYNGQPGDPVGQSFWDRH